MRKFLDYEMKLSRAEQPTIIGVTGHSDEAFMKQGTDAGMDDVKNKPFYLKEIKKVLEKYNRDI